MKSERLEPSPCWWSPALTLAERAAARPIAASEDARRGESGHDTHPAAAAAVRRLERWRRQAPFDRSDFLSRRLHADSLDDRELARLLATTPESLAASRGAPPSWVGEVELAHAAGEVIARTHPGEAPAVDPSGLAAAHAFVEPFVVPAMRRLFESARATQADYPDAPFDPEHAVRLFEPSLWTALVTRAAKVVILELNVARVRGVLAGDTPERRFADFVRQLRATPLRKSILREYPVLARLLVLTADNWTRCAGEMLAHLARDATRLSAELLGGADLGTLDTIVADAGDHHRNGHSVIVVGFSSGVRLVYKPRPLLVDVHFQELLGWVNAHGQTPALAAVHTVSMGDHGWAGFAAEAPCATAAEVSRFYERFGAYLALLHVLEATDFHYENVIASGEHPMLVDLEALFHPRTASPQRPDDPESVGWTALQHSVLRAGVLPFRAFTTGDSSGLDLSAVGGAGGQRTPNRHPVLVAAGTDEMHLARDYGVLPRSRNRPALGDRLADPAGYADRILAGFTATYRLLLRNRDALLALDGPIQRFANAPIRVVLRPTHHYALILGESYHPDVLRDALERDRLLDRLWVAVPSHPELERVVRWEHADLVGGDVPLFTSRPSSRDLYTTNGERIEGFFEKTGLDAAIERIQSLSEADLERQRWIINASVAALGPGRHDNAPALERRPVPTRGVRAPSADSCIHAARLVADRISSLALREGERTSWLALTLARERDWIIQPVGTDLYGGTAGIAFFLAHLADVTGDDDHRRLAHGVIDQVVQRLRVLLEAPPSQSATASMQGSLGAFGTLGGAVYALSHIGAMWGDPALLDVAEEVAVRASEEIESDRQLDIIGGVAGFAMALAALHAARRAAPLREAIGACADRLLATSTVAGPGIAWMTTLAARQPLVGFSHGASGMAQALLIAGRLLGDRRYTDTALAALRYERSTLDGSRANWPDFRILEQPPGEQPDPVPVMWSWCHGAPGIGLARLSALACVRDPGLADDLEIALESTVRHGFGSNDSLCHGDLGNLELFLRARELGHTGAWQHALAAEAGRIAARIARGDWRCGIPGGVETPGLMMGLAGIGYALLRLGAPERVPSVLSLEPTRRSPLRPTAR